MISSGLSIKERTRAEATLQISLNWKKPDSVMRGKSEVACTCSHCGRAESHTLRLR